MSLGKYFYTLKNQIFMKWELEASSKTKKVSKWSEVYCDFEKHCIIFFFNAKKWSFAESNSLVIKSASSEKSCDQ